MNSTPKQLKDNEDRYYLHQKMYIALQGKLALITKMRNAMEKEYEAVKDEIAAVGGAMREVEQEEGRCIFEFSALEITGAGADD